jgi:hypothetical protein
MKTLTYNEALGLLVQFSNKLACFKAYEKNWGADLCKSESVELFDRQSAKYDIDPTKFTKEQLISLGCGRWSEESELMLLPLWMALMLKKGITIESFDGEKVVIGKDEFDKDIRFDVLPTA